MRKIFLLLMTSFTLSIPTTFLYAQEEYTEVNQRSEEAMEDDDAHSLAHSIIMYLPNRVLDLFDIVRVRARIGPGLSVGVRVFEPLSLSFSSYATLYAGLPGPRRERTIRSPLGAELYNGLGLSYLKIETEEYGPRYSSTEIGFDIHAILAGASVGIDPLELLDFITGFVGVEVVEDDL